VIVVPLLFHSLRAKVQVTLTLGVEVFSTWPESAGAVKADVAIAYAENGALRYVLGYRGCIGVLTIR
jgi:hypothetical protein